MKEFLIKARLTKGCTSSFLALIRNVKNPQCLSKSIPICSVRSLYKILSKLLVRRLRSVIGSLVSSNLTTFVLSRNIVDGVLVMNKLIDLAKRDKGSYVVLKVYF